MLSRLMRRGDLVFLSLIVGIALALRVWAPWGDVFGAARVNFLETDAWYHVRLLESQIRNFPHHITVDPYASPDAQYVAVAPLLDTIIATAVVATRGTAASTSYIERAAALAPPIMGVLAVIAVWALGAVAFGRREGLLAAFLAAILPGHFLDRTLLGFVDHHALEAMLLFAVLAAMAASLVGSREPGAGSRAIMASATSGSRFPVPGSRELFAGVFLGLYLLGWTSGSLFVAMIGVWLITLPFIATTADVTAAAATTAILSAVALALVLLFQDPHLYRYLMQVVSLAGLFAIAIVAALAAPRVSISVLRASIAVTCVAGVIAAPLLASGFTQRVVSDLMRLNPDPARMSVLEARPLFMYSGNWDWSQPWEFFRSGFYLGAVAVVALAASVLHTRRIDHWLIVIVTACMFAATVGQNRFGYYLVPSCAVVIAWLAVRVLDWGGVPHAGNRSPAIKARVPMQREVAVILVAGLAVAPNLVPAAITTGRGGGMPGYWTDVMEWLRTQTPLPFSSDDYYFARYDPARLQSPAYTVMNWWDQGYWIVQTAHRVPVANPTQARAGDVAAFYVATSEAQGLDMMRAVDARYVIVDWELPFRELAQGVLGGRFENLVSWAGRPTSDFYRLCYAEVDGGWQHVWLFREAYYETMAHRLMVLGGAGASPANNTWVVRTEERSDSTGRRFCEVSERKVYRLAGEAKAAASQLGPRYEAVGLTPWQPAFPSAAVTGLRLVRDFRKADQASTEAPMARVFERVQ
jgi:dolichyl-phosphooligosaccharide-protein glycotransferase